MTSISDFSCCTCFRDILYAQDKLDLQILAENLGLTVSSRASMAFAVKKIEDYVLGRPLDWLIYMPVADLSLIQELVNQKAINIENAISMPVPKIPYMVYMAQILPFRLDEENSEMQVWLTQDLYDILSSSIEEALESLDETPYPIVDSLFWGALANFGIVDNEDMIELIHGAFSESVVADDAIDYFESYIPQRMLADVFDTFVNPTLSEEEVDYALSISNKEILEFPECSPGKLIADGASYPNLFANPSYFIPQSFEEECDMRYAHVFDDLDSLKTFEFLCYNLVQDLMYYSIDEVLSISKEYSFDSLHKFIAPGITEDEFNAAKMDILTHMPIIVLNGHCVDTVKDIKLVFDDQDEEGNDEYDDQYQPEFNPFDKPKDPSSLFINRVGRNDLCPCGSGLKYKNCHGKNLS